MLQRSCRRAPASQAPCRPLAPLRVLGLAGLVTALFNTLFNTLFTACQADTVPLIDALPDDAVPIQGTFDDKLRLVGYRLEPLPLVPGRPLTVTLYLTPLSPLKDTTTPFTLRAQLSRDCAGSNVAKLETTLGGKHLPLDRWAPGKILSRKMTLEVPETMRSERGTVWVTLERGKRRWSPSEQERTDRRQRFRLTDVAVAWQAPTKVPTLQVAKTTSPPTIDGRLEDPAWQTAATTGAFVQTDGGPIRDDTTRARLLWDDTHLYVAFESEDRDLYTTFTEHDAPLYEQEVVEVFLDPEGDGHAYHELEVSPANVTFDAWFPECRQEMALDWESGMQSAVQIDGTLNRAGDLDRGWTAELAIPFASMRPAQRPQPGTQWRINLYRLDRKGEKYQHTSGSSWSPTFTGDYHTPSRWGVLQFLDSAP